MGKRVIVRFTNSGAGEAPRDVELPSVDTLGANQIGFIVAQKDGQIVGMFPGHAVAGVFYPDEPSPIVPAQGLILGS